MQTKSNQIKFVSLHHKDLKTPPVLNIQNTQNNKVTELELQL